MANKDPKILRQNVIRGWRKRKNLCLRCGLVEHTGSCQETYIQVDMRNTKIPPKVVNEDKRKETIISYRKKKNLCLQCGKDIHDDTCVESYDKSDMRTKEEKQNDPRIVTTPKRNIIPEKQKYEDLKLNQESKTKFTRDFILIDIHPSENKSNRMCFIDIRYLTKKYSDDIICFIGAIEKIYPYADVLQLRRINNIMELGNTTDQEVVDHLHDCKKFISFPSKFTKYCIERELPCVELKEKGNVRNTLMRMK